MRNDKRRISNAARLPKGMHVPGKKKAASAAEISQDPIRTAIEAIFQDDNSVRAAITANLKERSTVSKAIADRAKQAFKNFSGSRYSSDERDRPNYLAPEDDLASALTTVIKKGVHAIRDSGVNHSIKLQDRPELRSLIEEKKDRNDTHVGTIDLKDLMDYIRPNPGALQHRPPLQQRSPNDPAFTSCEAELEAEKRIKKLQESTDTKGTVEGSEPDKSSSQDDSKSKDEDSDAQHLTTTQLVRDNVNLQMERATSPEDKLRYDIRPSRSNQNDIKEGVKTFELRSGPSDVTSYHDFNSLQIAFEHVWTEIFDGQLASLGRQLYEEYVKLKVFSGVDHGKDRTINTLDDLGRLMDEIRDFAKLTVDSTPPEFRSGTDGSQKDDSSFGDDIVSTAKGIAQKGVDAVNAVARAILDWVGLKKILLTWDSFKSPINSYDVAGSIDDIGCSIETNVVPGTDVEFVLNAGWDGMWWKQIVFTHATTKYTARIWTETGHQQSDRVSLPADVVRGGTLEFQKAAPGNAIHTGYYLLAGLDVLKPGTRVTFTWRKD